MLDPARALRGRPPVLLLAAVLFAVVFAVREAFGTPSDGLTFLYLLPICLLAMDRGARAGVAAALLGLVLVAVWDQTASGGLTPLAYVIRALVFVGVGVLCGVMADRVRRAAAESDRYFELSSQMLGIFTLEGRPRRMNRRWTEVLGYPLDELMSLGLADVVHPDDLHIAERQLAEILASESGGKVSHTVRMLTADGGVRHVTVNNTLDAEEGLLYMSATDVSERIELEEARRQAEARFRVAFEDSATGMAVVALTEEHSGQIVEANQELARILGVRVEDVLGTSGILDFVYEDDMERVRSEMAGLVTGDEMVVRSELRVVRPGGEVRWVHLTSSLLDGEDGVPMFRLSQLMDIDTRKRAEQQMQHMADHDPLSWLFNRRRFMDELNGELAGGRLRPVQAAVLLIDLDNFKQVNDLSGHGVGDEVIRTVSLALLRRLRSGDVAGRLGGDEFGVLLRRVTGEEAVLVSHDLLEAAGDALAQMDDEVARRVTLSIGVTLITGPRPGAGILIERADAAMYEAKRDGGDRVALWSPVPAGA